MHYRDYLVSQAGSLLLIAVHAAVLSYLVLMSFNVSSALSAPLLFAAVPAAVLSIALGSVSYNRRTKAIGFTTVAVACVIALVASLAGGHEGSVFADEGANLTLAFLIVFITTAGVFALSRTTPGCGALLVLSALVACFAEVMYQEHHIAAYIVLCISGIAVLMNRSFMQSVMRSGFSTPNVAPVALESVACATAVLALGALAFFAAVNPLHPPVIHPILSTVHVSIQENYVKGIGSDVQTVNPELESNTYTDATIETSAVNDDKSQAQENMEQTRQGEQNETTGSAGGIGLDNSDTGRLDALSIPQVPQWLWFVAPLLLIALGVLVVLVRRALRNRWIATLAKGDSAQAVQAVYIRTMKNLERFGYGMPDGVTPSEFAADNIDLDAALKTSQADGKGTDEKGAAELRQGALGAVGFRELTDLFVGACYGHSAPSATQIDRVVSFYKAFYRNVRKLVGTRRYLRSWARLR